MDILIIMTKGADVKIVYIMTQTEQTNRVVVVLVGVILKARCRGNDTRKPTKEK